METKAQVLPLISKLYASNTKAKDRKEAEWLLDELGKADYSIKRNLIR